ncbi:histone acetyltransferase HTATIP [Nematocida major]|uniref:histone acetyltransferase HTATIP n=1 Tax=Nematocida major TaxID=1912982 RepID=UPI002008031E|nr:histone acetyltransferase HTATIP [Nematocida major]KAH9386204.1 histone acetyltransferase HTATIP [Nematocida major]
MDANNGLIVGCKVSVSSMQNNEELTRRAEIIAIRNTPDGALYYVHYIGFNKRLDEWISHEKVDTKTIEFPKKKKQKEEPKNKNTAVVADEVYRVKNIEKVTMGEYTVDSWYFSPYPKDMQKDIIVCEYCLYYFNTEQEHAEHFEKCKHKRPPGRQIYRKGGISFFELDGVVHSNYSRNLSLLSKLFLDHKTLFYDIDVFLFYVMCIYNPSDPEEAREYKIVGYFSKEKESQHGYNIACLLVLPQHQRKGYGKILIDFSYLLSKRERVSASPEKPLSDLGLLSYREYWIGVISNILIYNRLISINDIRDMSSITVEDIIHTLQHNNMLVYYNGMPSIVIRDELINKYKEPRGVQLDPEYLVWEPLYQ